MKNIHKASQRLRHLSNSGLPRFGPPFTAHLDLRGCGLDTVQHGITASIPQSQPDPSPSIIPDIVHHAVHRWPQHVDSRLLCTRLQFHGVPVSTLPPNFPKSPSVHLPPQPFTIPCTWTDANTHARKQNSNNKQYTGQPGTRHDNYGDAKQGTKVATYNLQTRKTRL